MNVNILEGASLSTIRSTEEKSLVEDKTYKIPNVRILLKSVTEDVFSKEIVLLSEVHCKIFKINSFYPGF